MCETLAKRVMGIVLFAVGLADRRVVELTGLCDRSVRTLKKGLEGGDLDNMFHVAGGGRKRKLADVEGSILEEINNGIFHSHQQIADMIQEKYGIKVSLPVIGRLLKKTGSGD
jgi:transposase